MKINRPELTKQACILNMGPAAWLFEEYASRLARHLGIDISTEPRTCNYVLGLDEASATSVLSKHHSFIPHSGIIAASDKRILAECFQKYGVTTPETHLVPDKAALDRFLLDRATQDKEWCLKYPLSCGASGHCLLDPNGYRLPNDCPLPYVVQEFIRLEKPKVYRTYGFGGVIEGFNVRYFPSNIAPTPWVAHAKGAVYEHFDTVPTGVSEIALAALQSAGLHTSYGAVDVLQRPNGEWVVLEVGTDGMFTHVDCSLGDTAREDQLLKRISEAFWNWCASRE